MSVFDRIPTTSYKQIIIHVSDCTIKTSSNNDNTCQTFHIEPIQNLMINRRDPLLTQTALPSTSNAPSGLTPPDTDTITHEDISDESGDELLPPSNDRERIAILSLGDPLPLPDNPRLDGIDPIHSPSPSPEIPNNDQQQTQNETDINPPSEDQNQEEIANETQQPDTQPDQQNQSPPEVPNEIQNQNENQETQSNSIQEQQPQTVPHTQIGTFNPNQQFVLTDEEVQQVKTNPQLMFRIFQRFLEHRPLPQPSPQRDNAPTSPGSDSDCMIEGVDSPPPKQAKIVPQNIPERPQVILQKLAIPDKSYTFLAIKKSVSKAPIREEPQPSTSTGGATTSNIKDRKRKYKSHKHHRQDREHKDRKDKDKKDKDNTDKDRKEKDKNQ